MTFGRIIAPAACINGHDGGANLRSMLVWPCPVQTLIIVTQHTRPEQERERGSLYRRCKYTHTRGDQLHGARHNATGSWLCNYGLARLMGLHARPLCLGSPPVIPARVMKDSWAPKAPRPFWCLCSRMLLQVTGICLFTIQRRGHWGRVKWCQEYLKYTRPPL
jgi:hypothetical protein